MKHILIPTDFSDTARNALEYALELALLSGAECTLVHAWEMPYDFASQLDNRIGAIQKNARLKFERLVEEVKKEPRFQQVNLHYVIEEGVPARVILDVAEENEVDLVVIGLSRPNGLETFIAGNTGADVLGRSYVPVLAVPLETSFVSPSEIIYAAEYRQEDILHLEELSQWARLFNARLRIIHIEEEKTHEEKLRFRGFLEEVEDRLSYPYVSQELRVADEVEVGILKVAEESERIILAMTHYHKSFLKKIFGHSHTKAIAYKTKVPLLVYFEKEK